MSIFSLFGKKNTPPEKTKLEQSPPAKSRPKTEGGSNGKKVANSTIVNINEDELFAHSIVVQKHKAKATALKIDDIEREMTRDMIPDRTLAKATTAHKKTPPTKAEIKEAQETQEFPSTVAMGAPTTDSLVFGHTDVGIPNLAAETESVPLLEEAAILFASGQSMVAESMLQHAIYDQTLGQAETIGWHMLFDLYQIAGNVTAFENLAIEFARKFETSPPNWKVNEDGSAEEDNTPNEAATNIVCPSKLNGDIAKLMEKFQAAIKKNLAIRLDFSRIKEIDLAGCGLLLRELKSLKKSNATLTLVGAQDLANKIRATIEVGRREETDDSWLLLLEILQLLGQEQIFEETSIDYCVTFEVSPPSFEAPKNAVTTAMVEIKIDTEMSDRFKMPKVIDGNTDILTRQIAEHAKTHNPVLLDCSGLDRVEFGASAQLLNGLVPLSGKKDISIQFIEVNYPVLMLFNAMGLKNVASISPRKH